MDQACIEQVISEDYADLIIETEHIPDGLKAATNFCYTPINNTYSVAYVPILSLPYNIIQQYSYSVLPSCFGLAEMDSLDVAGVTKVQNIPTLNLTGEGILVGIIDTGIDYTHDAFKNADGTTRIVSIWDQTINTTSKPEGYYYGTEYTEEQINAALASTEPLSSVPSMDTNGHGTFLAGIAAGNKNIEQNFSGIVTNAKIVVVKLKQAKKYIRDYFMIPQDVDCYQENDIMFGIKYLLDISNKLKRPISICIGLSSSQGSHDGRHSLANYISSIADTKGVGVTVAAGNEGNTRHHYSGTVDAATGYNTVELRVGPNTQGFSMELWGNSPNLFSIDILSPTGEYISRIPSRLKETREITFTLEKTILYVDYEIIESQTGDELILIRFKNPTEGIWRFRVYSTINFNPRFNIWLPINNFIGPNTYFTNPDPTITLTAPANTVIPIIATAYDHTNQSLFINASKGYTRSNIVNPSFAAPGVNLLGPTLNNGYTTLSGTSVAAAFTAGVVAMILEWNVYDTLEIKNFLIRGAKRSEGVEYPNREWGYGTLDVFGAFSSLRG